jgi:hypothetical protein
MAANIPRPSFGRICDGPAVLIRSFCHPTDQPISRGDKAAQNVVLRMFYKTCLRLQPRSTVLGRLVCEIASQRDGQDKADTVRAVWKQASALIKKDFHLLKPKDLESFSRVHGVIPRPSLPYEALEALIGTVAIAGERVLAWAFQPILEHGSIFDHRISPEDLELLRLKDVPKLSQGAYMRTWMQRPMPHVSLDRRIRITDQVERILIPIHSLKSYKDLCIGLALLRAVRASQCQAVHLILNRADSIDPILCTQAIQAAVTQNENAILKHLLFRKALRFNTRILTNAYLMAKRRNPLAKELIDKAFPTIDFDPTPSSAITDF